MTDRELLEQAAKAAGITVDGLASRHIAQGVGPDDLLIRNERGGHSVWNPLTDDGDALRLLNKLGLELRHVHGKAHAGAQDKFWCTEQWFPDGDQNAATRRAIVRAAAEIGRPA